MTDTRTQILLELCCIMRDYGLDVDNAWTDLGVVSRPGKFQGEPITTLYFHSAMLNGHGEAFDDVTFFDTTPIERDILGGDNNLPIFALHEDGNGFAYGSWISEKQARMWRSELELKDDE